MYVDIRAAARYALGKIYTVFIRIVAAATINFSLAWMRLLIEDGSYSRAALVYFRPILDGVRSPRRL